MSREPTTDTRERAARYVRKYGRFHRVGVYGVRYPQYAPRVILRNDPDGLIDEVAARMENEIEKGNNDG